MPAHWPVVGWERVRRGDNDLWGWLLLGAAGWFKNEGILILPACWVAVRVFHGRVSASIMWLLAGLALPVAWHVGCRLAGGGVYDFAPIWEPDRQHAFAATQYVFRLAFVEPWRYGFIWPLAVLGGILTIWRCFRKDNRVLRTFAEACLAAILLAVAFVGIFSLSRAGDFEWHLNSMERLLWLPSLLLVREFLGVVHIKPNEQLALTYPPR